MADLPDIAREALALAEKATPGARTVYRCQFCDTDLEYEWACGFDGQTLDASRDQCNHTLPLGDASPYAHASAHYATLARAFLAERERAERLEKALRYLRNEAAGCWGMAERELRDLLGNTNYACVEKRIQEADAALRGQEDA